MSQPVSVTSQPVSVTSQALTLLPPSDLSHINVETELSMAVIGPADQTTTGLVNAVERAPVSAGPINRTQVGVDAMEQIPVSMDPMMTFNSIPVLNPTQVSHCL
jgi:hypothetical protein